MEMNPLSDISDLSLSPTQSRNQSHPSPPSWLGVGTRTGLINSSKSLSSPPSSTHVPPSSVTGNDYLEMAASVGSSSASLDGYMPMSPVGSSYSVSSYGVSARTPTGKGHSLTLRLSSEKNDKQKCSGVPDVNNG